MKLAIDGQSFSVELENNAQGESVRAMCPVTLDMSRSGGHGGAEKGGASAARRKPPM